LIIYVGLLELKYLIAIIYKYIDLLLGINVLKYKYRYIYNNTSEKSIELLVLTLPLLGYISILYYTILLYFT